MADVHALRFIKKCLDKLPKRVYALDMITTKTGDLLKAQDVDVIVHRANLFHTFGGGIARFIGKIWPEAYEADCLPQNAKH